MAQHSAQILETLNPGATAAEIREAESLLQHELPLAVRAVYRCEGYMTPTHSHSHTPGHTLKCTINRAGKSVAGWSFVALLIDILMPCTTKPYLQPFPC